MVDPVEPELPQPSRPADYPSSGPRGEAVPSSDIPIGDACAEDRDCGSGMCVTEIADARFPGGYCTTKAVEGRCPASGVPARGDRFNEQDRSHGDDQGEADEAVDYCLRACARQAECRVEEGYRCAFGFCLPGRDDFASDARDRPDSCRPGDDCGVPEASSATCCDLLDNDGDGNVDCEDPGCAQTPGCAEGWCEEGAGAGQIRPDIRGAFEGEYVQIAAGEEHTCGLRSDGHAVCLGSDEAGQSTPPTGRFVALAAGSFHTCGLRPDGHAVCWGAHAEDQQETPEEALASLTSGWRHACGVTPTGQVLCWGDDEGEQSTPPEGLVAEHVVAGLAHSCALLESGAVTCWGRNEWGQAAPPAEVSEGEGCCTDLVAGGGHNCALRHDGQAVCWGANGNESGVLGQATPPAWRFASLTLGAMHSCGLTDEGAAVCWGLDIDGQSLPPGLSFTALSAGGWHTCGLTSDASIVCWGRDDRGQAPSVP